LLIKSKLFLQQLFDISKLSRNIFCKKMAKLCNGLPVEDTMILRGNSLLWILDMLLVEWH